MSVILKITKRLILFLERKSMYPTSLKFDFYYDRDEILKLLRNVDLDSANPNPDYLVRFFYEYIYIIKSIISLIIIICST